MMRGASLKISDNTAFQRLSTIDFTHAPAFDNITYVTAIPPAPKRRRLPEPSDTQAAETQAAYETQPPSSETPATTPHPPTAPRLSSSASGQDHRSHVEDDDSDAGSATTGEEDGDEEEQGGEGRDTAKLDHVTFFSASEDGSVELMFADEDDKEYSIKDLSWLETEEERQKVVGFLQRHLEFGRLDFSQPTTFSPLEGVVGLCIDALTEELYIIITSNADDGDGLVEFRIAVRDLESPEECEMVIQFICDQVNDEALRDSVRSADFFGFGSCPPGGEH